MAWLRIRKDIGLKKDSGFLGTGHYPIPVLEAPMGLASPDTVVFTHDSEYVYAVLGLSFKSILDAPQNLINAAVADMVTEHYETVREKDYSSNVKTFIQRSRPDVQVLPDARVNGVADFGIACKGSEVFVETRWHPGRTDESTYTELLRFLDKLPADVGYLVVVDGDEPPGKMAHEVIESNLGTRGRILAWQERNGAKELEDALNAIIGT